MVNVGVNGAGGRIGKFLVKALLEEGIDVVAFNDLVSARKLVDNYNTADSTHGSLDFYARYLSDKEIEINGRTVAFYSERDASRIPWREHGVKIVEECSGFYTEGVGNADARLHLSDSVERVIVSAPARGEGLKTLVMGVNHEEFSHKRHSYISNASCTTKALAGPLKILLDAGIEIYSLLMDTVHSATNSQRVLDFCDEPSTLDNIVLAKTGEAIATGEVIPSLKGAMDGFAARVPTSDGSFANLYFVGSHDGYFTAEDINKLFLKSVSREEYCGRVGYLEDSMVSSKRNIVGRDENGIVIGSRTRVMELPFKDGNRHVYLIGLVSGYDNELGPRKDQTLLTKYIAEKCEY